MNKTITLLTCILFFTHINLLKAQIDKDSIDIIINPYASFRGNMAVYDNKMDLQDNVSRVGLITEIKKGKVTFLAATELRLHLFQGGAGFNIDDSPNSDFLDVQTINSPQSISNRLGYIGFDFEKYGRITFGKQWSVYYDITSYTNQFEIFGGNATATYIGGTDGGDNGTGRANSVIIYRNQFGPFLLGAQMQARGSNNNKFIDGFGISGQLEVTRHIIAGLAFNRALLSDNLIHQGKIIGLKGQPTYYAVGFKYKSDKLLLSVVGVIEKNGDFAKGTYHDNFNNIIHPTVVFDSKGLELYANYNLKKFSIHAGYNLYTPNVHSIMTENNQSPLEKGFKTNDIILGVTYQPLDVIRIYAEQRLSYGQSASNQKELNVSAIGMTLNISKTYNSRIAIK